MLALLAVAQHREHFGEAEREMHVEGREVEVTHQRLHAT